MEWAIVHKIGRRRVPRVIVTGVPADARRPEVKAVLEAAGVAASYSEGGEPWGNHDVVPETRWPAAWDHGGAPARTWTWEALMAPSGKRIALDVSAGLHSRLTLQAARQGLPMNAWCIRALETALAVDEQAVS